jgi:hypothetical protein
VRSTGQRRGINPNPLCLFDRRRCGQRHRADRTQQGHPAHTETQPAGRPGAGPAAQRQRHALEQRPRDHADPDTAGGDPVGLDHLVLNSAARKRAPSEAARTCERLAAARIDAG